MENTKDFIIKEYEIVTDKINMLVNYDLKMLNLGLIIFGVGIGYGMQNNTNNSLLIIFFPFGIYIVLLFAMHVYIIVTSLCGYKKFIEEQINQKYFKCNFMLCETLNQKFTFKSIALYGSYFFYGILLAFSVYKSVFEAYIKYPSTPKFWLIVVIHIIACIIIGLSMYKFLISFNKAYHYAHQEFQKKYNNVE